MEVEVLANSSEGQRIHQIPLRVAQAQITDYQTRYFRPAFSLVKRREDPLPQQARRGRELLQRRFAGKLSARNVKETIHIDRHRGMVHAPKNVPVGSTAGEYLVKRVAK